MIIRTIARAAYALLGVLYLLVGVGSNALPAGSIPAVLLIVLGLMLWGRRPEWAGTTPRT